MKRAPRDFSFDDILICDSFKNSKHIKEIYVSTVGAISHNNKLLNKFETGIRALCGI